MDISEQVAIWLQNPILLINQDGVILRSSRVSSGCCVRIEGGILATLINAPTHKVIGCYGTSNSSVLHISCISLHDNELTVIDGKKEPILY